MFKFTKIILVCFITFLTACSTTPPLPRDAKSTCMIITLKSIIDSKNAHAQLQSDYSKMNQCRAFAEARSRGSRPLANQSAVGNVVIQNSINQSNDVDNYNKNYQTCMSDPNITDIRAVPAFTQFERVLFGLSNIKTLECPADFQNAFEDYKSIYRETVILASKYNQLNTSTWTSIVRLKIPGNEVEKSIIDNDKKLFDSFINMKTMMNQKTGWCPNSGFTEYYPCK